MSRHLRVLRATAFACLAVACVASVVVATLEYRTHGVFRWRRLAEPLPYVALVTLVFRHLGRRRLGDAIGDA